MYKLLAVLLLSFIALSCQPEGRVFSENKELSAGLKWMKDDVVEFQVPIEDMSSTYDIGLNFRYSEGYQFDELNIGLTQISPSGDEVYREFRLKIRDENGDYIGDPALDIWDSEHELLKDVNFPETGTYTYKLEHVMPRDPLHFAMEIGLILDKSE